MATLPIDGDRNEDPVQSAGPADGPNGKVTATGQCFEQCCFFPPIPPPTDTTTFDNPRLDRHYDHADVTTTTFDHPQPAYDLQYPADVTIVGQTPEDSSSDHHLTTALLKYLETGYDHSLDITTAAGSKKVQLNSDSRAEPPYLPTSVQPINAVGQETKRKKVSVQTLEEHEVVPDQVEAQPGAAAGHASESLSKSHKRRRSGVHSNGLEHPPSLQDESVGEAPPTMHESHFQDGGGHHHQSPSTRGELFPCPVEGCTSVHEPFMTQGALDKHMVTHTKIRKYGCDMCTYRCRYPRELERHSATHQPKGEKTIQFLCSECETLFTRDDNLKRHIRDQHLGSPVHQPQSGLLSPPPTVRGERFASP